jgi:AcrR family transcriptional regulator
MERRAIFSAALRLIKEGKFQATTLPEIALYANISASTLPYFFASRQILLAELAADVLTSLNAVVDETQKESLTFENQFLKLGSALFSHYVGNPEVIAFVEQFERNLSNEVSAESFRKFLDDLSSFFENGIAKNYVRDYNPQALAVMFHDNVMSTAKNYDGSDEDFNVRMKILWNGIAVK